MVKIDIRAIEMIGEDGVARDEPVMLELQGVIEVGDDKVQPAGVKMGTLFYDGKGPAELRVGHHLIKGKVVELKKPFAILKKSAAPASAVDAMEASSLGSESPATAYDVAGIIRRKIIFSTRPTSILSKTQQNLTTVQP